MIAILAIGETFVIITAGIDLSVGAVAGVISLSVAMLLTNDLGFASSIAGAISISLAIGVSSACSTPSASCRWACRRSS